MCFIVQSEKSRPIANLTFLYISSKYNCIYYTRICLSRSEYAFGRPDRAREALLAYSWLRHIMLQTVDLGMRNRFAIISAE